MAPTTEKPKHVRKAPDFIDDKFIKTLSKEKQDYWANRKAGKNGNPDLTPAPKAVSAPQDIVMGFDRDGNMIAKTRAVRRHKDPSDPKNTKKYNTRKK